MQTNEPIKAVISLLRRIKDEELNRIDKGEFALYGLLPSDYDEAIRALDKATASAWGRSI